MPVSPDEFRRIALSQPGASESSHMDHPDFRVGGKIFATLGYPDGACGMVKLPPELQHEFSQRAPKAFVPVKGTWGKQGATTVILSLVSKRGLREAMEIACKARATKPQKTKSVR